jgi:uncharacterized protein
VEVLAVSGDRDPFGVPEPAATTHVHVLAGEGHELDREPARVGAVVATWLGRWSSGRAGAR